MPSTIFQNLPYPAPTDPVDVPGDIQALAEAIDTKMLDKAVINNKGEVLIGLADNNVTVVGAGADKQVLVADSLATPGAKWDYVGVPTGSVNAFAGSAAPSGWRLCNGDLVSRTTFASLFAVIGTTYGVGDGSTTFALPDLRTRVPVGLFATDTDTDPTATNNALNTLGKTGGDKVHTLITSEMPSHTHTQDAHTHTQNAHGHTATTGNGEANGTITIAGGAGTSTAGNHVTGFSASPTSSVPNGSTDFMGATHTHDVAVGNATATNQSTTATNQSTGGGAAHNNLQPYIVMNYIIKT